MPACSAAAHRGRGERLETELGIVGQHSLEGPAGNLEIIAPHEKRIGS